MYLFGLGYHISWLTINRTFRSLERENIRTSAQNGSAGLELQLAFASDTLRKMWTRPLWAVPLRFTRPDHYPKFYFQFLTSNSLHPPTSPVHRDSTSFSTGLYFPFQTFFYLRLWCSQLSASGILGRFGILPSRTFITASGHSQSVHTTRRLQDISRFEIYCSPKKSELERQQCWTLGPNHRATR